jgi:SAM-dependent methyltransferase
MPKQIKAESFKYHFLRAVERESRGLDQDQAERLSQALERLEVAQVGPDVLLTWNGPAPRTFRFESGTPRLYLRGDSERAAARQHELGLPFVQGDEVGSTNARLFRGVAQQFLGAVGARVAPRPDPRLSAERSFHDRWAGSADPDVIDVRAANEACTAPEMRYIHRRLGDVAGLAVLDVGCGLGETSVYFAQRGAEVTASDLSPGMLEATTALARRHGVALTTHQANAQGLALGPGATFDVIHAGNLLHHVEIDTTLAELKRYLRPGGRLVTWDPLAYNPLINVYRSRATAVRTADEHPLTWTDLKRFERHFSRVERRYFWLTTLGVFVYMALVERRDPNRERYWKAVIAEADRWRPAYRPLEALDRVLLALLPPLRLLCWNVVVIAWR